MKVSAMKRKVGKIENDRLYTVDEIMATGLIVGRSLTPVKSKIYSLIRNGILPATNLGSESGRNPRWVVKGKDLKKYVGGKMVV